MSLSDNLKSSIRRMVDVLEENEVMNVDDFMDCVFYWLSIARHKETLKLFNDIATKGYREKMHKIDIVCLFLTELSELSTHHIKMYDKKGEFYDEYTQSNKSDHPRRAAIATNA